MTLVNKKLGFIGLGIMGQPMCKNLIRNGFSVGVYARRDEPARVIEDFGGTRYMTLKELAISSDVILTMLPDASDVKDVILGEVGLYNFIKKGTVVIDMSSINPIETRKIAKELNAKGIGMLDAPVSGGEENKLDPLI